MRISEPAESKFFIAGRCTRQSNATRGPYPVDSLDRLALSLSNAHRAGVSPSSSGRARTPRTAIDTLRLALPKVNLPPYPLLDWREWPSRGIRFLRGSHGGRLKNGFEPVFHFAIDPKIKWRPKHVRHETDDVPDWGGLHPSQRDGLAMKGYQRVATSKAQGKSYTETGNPARLAPSSRLAYPSNLIECGKNHEALGHGAVFPVALPTFFIRLLTDSGDHVFDPFAGAGTTLIACERENRMGYACEISAAYCDIIVERWQQVTGRTARRA